jgi:hypothetical protein
VSCPRSATTRSAPRWARAAAWPPRSTPRPSGTGRGGPPPLRPGRPRPPRLRHLKAPGRLQEQRRVGLAGQPQPAGSTPSTSASNRPRSRAEASTATMLRRPGPPPSAARGPAARSRRTNATEVGKALARDRVGRRGSSGPWRCPSSDRLAVWRVGRVASGQYNAPGGEEAGDLQAVQEGDGPAGLGHQGILPPTRHVGILDQPAHLRSDMPGFQGAGRVARPGACASQRGCGPDAPPRQGPLPLRRRAELGEPGSCQRGIARRGGGGR